MKQELREEIADWLADRDGYNWQFYTDNEKVEFPKEYVLAFLRKYREEADEILPVIEPLIRKAITEEIKAWNEDDFARHQNGVAYEYHKQVIDFIGKK